MSDEDRQAEEADQQPTTRAESADSRSLRGTFVSARQGIGRSFDRLSGAEFRQQFEEFSNVVTTTVLGIHRDQSELSARLERIEKARPSNPPINTPANQLAKLVFVSSLIAAILATVALLRTI